MASAFDRPASHRKAAILSIGDELILGQGLDTNAQWLAAALLERGVRPTSHLTVEDQLSPIIEAIESLAYENDLIVISGGLGPTADDLTRQALAAVLDEPLIEDAASLAHLTEWAASRNRSLNDQNRQQALRPKSAIAIPNPLGTAPGLALVLPPDHELERTHHVLVVALPGPPGENQPMFREHVAAMLRPPAGQVVRTRTLRHVGIPESTVAQRLGDLMSCGANPAVGTTASGGIVTVRIRYEGDASRADAALNSTIARVQEALAPHGFGWNDQAVNCDETSPLPAVVLAHLNEAKQTLVVAESCTGGLLGSAITEIPGSSRAFLGGWQTYANSMKKHCLGVPAALLDDPASPAYRGAVSEEVAVAMAEGAIRASDRLDQPANHALAITGIAGPDGGSPEKPVGTVWIARASRSGVSGTLHTEARHFLISGDREDVRQRACTCALAMLLFHLRSDDAPDLTWQVH